jgi:phosphatidate cytidylyltransferase
MPSASDDSAGSKKSSAVRRIAIGTALGLATFAAVFAVRPVIAVVVAAWSVLATLEFLRLLSRAEIHLSRWLLPILNVAVVTAACLGWLPEFLIAPIAIVFLAAVAARDTRPRTPVYGTFVIIYLGFLPAHLILLKNLSWVRGLSPWLVFFPLILTWTNDTAALAFGRLIGRHKLAPTVSPNKTIEGYVAGLVFSAVLAALYLHRVAPFTASPAWWLAVVGIGLGTLAQAGDLFESVFKRAVGLKDSSAALADHGGFLDRIDSLLFTIPAFYYICLHLR